MTFNFSVKNDGSKPVVSEIQFNGLESDILVGKHTSRAPVIPIPGTFSCTICGTPQHPTLDNSGTQTFNLLMFSDPDGNSSFQTQVTLGMTIFNGIGIQENCTDSGNNQTTCGIESGDGLSDTGFMVSSTSVFWSGNHTFDNQISGPQDCSGVSGTWNWESINFGTLSGTFESTAMCPPVLVFEDFEDDTVTYVLRNELAAGAIISEDISGILNENYFGRVMLSQFDDPNYNINNIQGLSYWGTGDIDAAIGTNNASINWENLDVSGSNTVIISALFAENIDDDFTPFDWDFNDRILIEVSFDGGPFTQVSGIESTEPGGDTTNTQIAIDSDLDGVGDSPLITDILAQHSITINTDGISEITVRMNFLSLNAVSYTHLTLPTKA